MIKQSIFYESVLLRKIFNFHLIHGLGKVIRRRSLFFLNLSSLFSIHGNIFLRLINFSLFKHQKVGNQFPKTNFSINKQIVH